MPFLLLFFLFFAGCAHTPKPISTSNHPPKLILTSQTPEGRALSVAEAAAYENQVVYSADDVAIYVALTFHQFEDRHTVKWRWIAPWDRVYLETTSVPVGTRGDLYKDVTVFHKISLKGEVAAQKSGLWQIQAIVDEKSKSPLLIEQAFRVDPVLPPPLSLPLPQDDPIIVEPFVEVAVQPLPLIEPSITAKFFDPVPPPTLFFGFGQATLTPDTKQILVEQIETFKRAKRIVIYGYHDATGSTFLNRHLARKRAEGVADFLMAQGIAPKVIRIEAKEQVYFAPNDTPKGRRQNRRVTLEIEE